MYDHERSLVESFSGRPFVLLGVNTDSKLSTVKKAIRENNLNWRSWYDGRRGPIVKDYAIRGYPTIFLVDHTGIIRYKNLRGKSLDMALEQLVAAAEADGMRGGAEPGPKFREFVDMSGKHKTMAAYVGFEKGKVILLKEDDKEVKVPWKRLSYADRQYVAIQRLKAAGLKKAAKNDADFKFEEPFTFRDSTGNHSVDATFIALNERKAILWKTDGSEIAIAWKKLSDDSKDYITDEIKRMK
jgi:hypothetical protein